MNYPICIGGENACPPEDCGGPHGFDELKKTLAGKINRQDLASFIIEKFKSNFAEKDLIQLRQAHYDDASMLEAMYRKMKDTGEVPEFLKEALRKQFQVPDDAPRKSKKSLTKEYINDVQLKSEENA